MGHASAGVLLITEKENALPRPAGSSVRKKGRSSKNSQLRRATRQVDHRGNEALALRIVDSNAAAPLESQEESFDAPAPRAGASTPEDDSKRPAVERQESSHEYAATVSSASSLDVVYGTWSWWLTLRITTGSRRQPENTNPQPAC